MSWNEFEYPYLANWRKQWTTRFGLNHEWLPKNHLLSRQPDLQGDPTLRDVYLKNAELFLHDPEYPCRRPAQSKVFAKSFSPEYKETCTPQLRVPVYSYDSKVAFRWESLDPKRIYEIHYLVASEGATWDESWGHAMLRLVVCAPQANSAGPKCLPEDDRHDLVVGYDPVYPGSTPDVWKTFVGDYSTHVFLNSFPDIVRSYTQKEFRSLTAYPLRLRRSELETIVFKVLEDYWQYQGTYYALTNNCSSEIVDLLRGVLELKKMEGFHPETPLQLAKKLIELGYVNVSKKIIYPSEEPLLVESFLGLKSLLKTEPTIIESNWNDWHEYEARSTPDQRKSLILKIDKLSLKSSVKVALFQTLLRLEKRILSTLGSNLDEEVAETLKLERPDFELQINQARQEIQVNQLTTRGYGVALSKDLDEVLLENRFTRAREIDKKIEAWALVRFSGRLKIMGHVAANIKRLNLAIGRKP